MKKKIMPLLAAALCMGLAFGTAAYAGDAPDGAKIDACLSEDGLLIEGEAVTDEAEYLESEQHGEARTFKSSSSGYDISRILDSDGKYNGREVYTAEGAAEYCISLMKDHVETAPSRFIVAVQYSVPDLGGSSPYTYAYDAYTEAFAQAFNDSLFVNGKGGDYLLYSMYGRPFYVTNSCKYFTDGDDGLALVYATPGKATYYTSASQESEFEKKAASVVSELKASAGSSDYDKVCAVYDYICGNVTYDYDNLGTPDYYIMYTAYGALCDGQAVCQGYANLFYYLCNEMGVPCRIVAGTGYTGSASGPHAWNIVKMGDTWYHVDSTWGASYAQWYSGRYFFLQSEANFVNGHNATGHVMDYMTGIQYIDYTSEGFLSAYPISATEDYCHHSYSLVSSKEASCGVYGYEVYRCSSCGETYEDTYDKLTHSYSVTGRKEPSCTEEGYETRVCANCGDVKTEILPASGHSYKVTDTVEAGCVDYGYTEYTCSVCGHSRQDDLVPSKGGHSLELTDSVAMTHTSDGYEEYTCTECGAVFRDVHEAEADHVWGSDYEVTHSSGTCGDDLVLTCVICRETMLEESDLHCFVDYEAKEPTCDDDGWEAYSQCRYCGYVKGGGEIVTHEALGHDWQGRDPDSDGCLVCSVCGKVSHEPGSSVTETEATCDNEGSISYTCSLCGMQVTETTPALGHDWDEGEVLEEADDGHCSKIQHHCSRCGGEKLDDIHDGSEHVVEEVAAKEATCVDEGHTAGTRCEKCGMVLSGLETALPSGHTPGDPEETPATCTEDGYTGDIRCSACGELLEKGNHTGAHGHSLVYTAPVAATCTEGGLTDGYSCSACGEVLDPAEEVPATGHSLVQFLSEATCTEDGCDTGLYCETCGYEETEGSETPATGHRWVESSTGTEATCYEDGQEPYVYCEYCGEVESDGSVIPAGHTLTHMEYAEPSEYEDGNIECWYCYSCDTFFLDEDATMEIPFEDTVLAWEEEASGEASGTVTEDSAGLSDADAPDSPGVSEEASGSSGEALSGASGADAGKVSTGIPGVLPALFAGAAAASGAVAASLKRRPARK